MKQSMPPAHPGNILRTLYIEPAGVTITEAAAHLGIARKTLSQLLNGKMGISAEMAIRLSRAFATSPELWLNLQQGFELWHAEKKMKKIKVIRLGKRKQMSIKAD